MTLNMLQLDAKLGAIFGPLIIVRGHFQEIGIARRVEKFGVGESELTDQKEETCAKHKISFTE